MADRVDRNDVRVLVGAVAQFAASFESRLRRIEPALTLSQFVALERIAEAPRLRPFQLATQMRISRQLAWQTCKRLEALGLLSMSNMSAGKRGVEVEATEAGIAHLRAVAALHAAIAESLGARVGGGDRLDPGALRSGLQRLTAAVARMAPDGEAESEGHGAGGRGMRSRGGRRDPAPARPGAARQAAPGGPE